MMNMLVDIRLTMQTKQSGQQSSQVRYYSILAKDPHLTPL